MGDFTFKQFKISQDRCAMKVGTDGVLLGAWASGGGRVLDIGAGTGLVSLMMAQRFPLAQVVGVEIDASAAGQAAENVATSPFADRVRIENMSLQDYAASVNTDYCEGGRMALNKDSYENKQSVGFQPFDAIVSNPPFFVGSLKNPDAQRSLARHTDSLPFSELFRCVRSLLSADGVFSAIVPTAGVDAFLSEAYLVGLSLVRRCDVRTVARKPAKRTLLAFSFHTAESICREEVVLQEADGSRSEWYRGLTEAFYVR